MVCTCSFMLVYSSSSRTAIAAYRKASRFVPDIDTRYLQRCRANARLDAQNAATVAAATAALSPSRPAESAGTHSHETEDGAAFRAEPGAVIAPLNAAAPCLFAMLPGEVVGHIFTFLIGRDKVGLCHGFHFIMNKLSLFISADVRMCCHS